MELIYRARHPKVLQGRPPLLVLLHGVRGNELGMEAIAEAMDPRFLALSVRGPYQSGPDAYRWFDVQFTANDLLIDSAEAESSRRALLQFINDAVMGFGADPRRVYLLGFSQGATLAWSLALTAPQRLRGVVGIAGRVLPEVAPLVAPAADLRHLTVLIQHGQRDPVVDPARGRDARDLFAELGLMLGYREYDAAHQLCPAMLLDAQIFLSAQLDRLGGNIGATVAH